MSLIGYYLDFGRNRMSPMLRSRGQFPLVDSQLIFGEGLKYRLDMTLPVFHWCCQTCFAYVQMKVFRQSSRLAVPLLPLSSELAWRVWPLYRSVWTSATHGR